MRKRFTRNGRRTFLPPSRYERKWLRQAKARHGGGTLPPGHAARTLNWTIEDWQKWRRQERERREKWERRNVKS